MATTWYLAPCLISLRTELNQLAPGRDRASDGSIGDTAHSARTSDHNPDDRGMVHAIDVDCSGPWPAGLSMEKLVQTIVVRHRTGQDSRLQNVIYNRRIWSRSWGWTARAYGGANLHDKHAHFSARYAAAAEVSTRPWGLLHLLEGDDMTEAELIAGLTKWAKTAAGADAIARAVLLTDGIIPAPEGAKNADGSANTHWGAWSFLRWGYEAAVSARGYAAAAAKLAGQDNVDEQAIVAGVLAGLDPSAIAAAIPQELAEQVADELSARLAA